MKKRGFTLIELLAAIVVLAIIALIAVPIILNIINKAKEGAAERSVNTYIEAINNYQVLALLKNESSLIEGKYNVANKNNEYPIINDLVQINGKKPTQGTIDISKEGTVNSALVCMNGFLIRYINGEISTISDDCSDIDVVVEYSIDKQDWQLNRILTIEYPIGNYEYHFKVSGKAIIDNNEIEKNKDIISQSNILSIELLENQTIETWIVKKGKVIGKTLYIENKIDNVKVIEPEANYECGTMVLDQFGLKQSCKLDITSKQDGTSFQYSINDGTTWINYNSPIYLSSSSVKIKAIRDVSKMGSDEKNINSTTASGIIGEAAYDNNEDTTVSTITTKISVDNNAIGKNMYLSWSKGGTWGSAPTLSFLDENSTVISSYKTTNVSSKDKINIIIPEKTKYINLSLVDFSYIAELRIIHENVINIDSITTLKTDGLHEYGEVTVNYDSVYNKNKMYRINDGEWKKYEGKFNISTGDTVYVKSDYIDSKTETLSASKEYTNTTYKNLYNVFDKNETTIVYATVKDTIIIDPELYGKTLTAIWEKGGSWSSAPSILTYDKDNNLLNTYVSNSVRSYEKTNIPITSNITKMTINIVDNSSITDIKIN